MDKVKFLSAGAILTVILVTLFGCTSPDEPPQSQADAWDLAAIRFDASLLSGETTRIAIIDSGTNLPEQITDGINALDDSNDIKDNIGHGTQITSKLFELCPFAEIVMIKVVDKTAELSPDILAKGIDRAVQEGCQVINLSLGSVTYSNEVEQAVARAVDAGVILVASAGNGGQNELYYPAALDGVFSVMARDKSNVDLPSSNRSSLKKSFSAPGDNICIQGVNTGGTSIAAVYVSAVAAKMKSVAPFATADEIQQALMKTCRFGTEYSYGMIDVFASVDLIQRI